MGGGGNYGFWIDEDFKYGKIYFKKGTSQVSETYGQNISKGFTRNEDFKVYAIQLFCFKFE